MFTAVLTSFLHTGTAVSRFKLEILGKTTQTNKLLSISV